MKITIPRQAVGRVPAFSLLRGGLSNGRGAAAHRPTGCTSGQWEATDFIPYATSSKPDRSERRSLPDAIFRKPFERVRRGFTLVELSLAMVMGSLAGAMILALFNQQITFLQIYRTQNFLTEEAPIISTYISRIISSADRYRLHDSLEDALAGRNPRMGPSPVAVFNFRQPDGGPMRATILSFEDRGEGEQLYYYVVPEVGVMGEPEWSVTSTPANVEFLVEEGILRVTLTGPAGEQITYSGAMQL